MTSMIVFSMAANYVVFSKKQTVPDTRDSWSYSKPEKQIMLEDAAMKWYMVQISCSVYVRGAEIKGFCQ